MDIGHFPPKKIIDIIDGLCWRYTKDFSVVPIRFNQIIYHHSIDPYHHQYDLTGDPSIIIR